MKVSQLGHKMSHMNTKTPVTSQELGAVLKGLIREKGVRQSDISTETGIPLNSFNRKLNGGVFNFEELMKVAQSLDTPLSEILSRAEALTRQNLAA